MLFSAPAVGSGADSSAGGLSVIRQLAADPSAPVAGQELVRWRRLDAAGVEELAGGAFASSFDYWTMELDELPRGTVEVEIRGRGGNAAAHEPKAPRVWRTVPPTGWKLELASSGSPAAEVASAMRRAEHRPEEAARWWREALDLATALAPLERAFVHARFADARLDLGFYDEALRHHERALALRRSVQGVDTDLQIASSLDQVGIAAWYLGDQERYRRVWEEALSLRRLAAPGSLAVAKSLNNRSLLLPADEARVALLEALAIRRRLDPRSQATAGLLSNLAAREPDPETALALLADAEEIFLATDPRNPRLPHLWTLRADRYRHLGRPAEAEEQYRHALQLLEHIRPDSFDLAEASQKLGNLLLERRDSERAEVHLRRAFEIAKRISQRSVKLTTLLLDLGLVAKHRGDMDLARRRYHEAIEQGSQHPENPQVQRWVAIAFNNLGSLAQSLSENEAAFRHYTQAARRLERVAPQGPDLARTLGNIGHLHLVTGELEKAEAPLLAARDLLAELTSDDAERARALGGLAELRWRQGRGEEAERLFRQAVGALDAAPLLQVGGAVGRARSWSEQAPLISRFARFLVEEDRPREAFALVENARARSSQLRLMGRVPAVPTPANQEGAAGEDGPGSPAALRARYDKALLRLGATNGTAGDEALRAELAELRERMRLLQEVGTDPLPAAVEASSLLDGDSLGETIQRLPTGTILLSYLVDWEETLLFVASAEGVRALHLPVGHEELRRDVELLRSAIARREGLSRPRYRRVAERLTRQLLTPASAQIRAANSIVLVLDGPLHRLPFGALPDPFETSAYWIESHTLTHSPSLPALVELRTRPSHAQRPVRLAAFGASTPAAESVGRHPVLHAATRAGLRLEPLPHAAAEVEALRALFGSEAQSFTGRLATEEQVERVAPAASILHFAGHAFIDEASPLQSGLVLSIPAALQPGQANGVLQAWEVVERLRLKAELVTLSGCETGLGRSFPGQGLLGLTRAFHAVGARAVLASLWRVSDASTSRLMQRFYTHLRGGSPLGVALRRAQIELLTAGHSDGLDFSRPYHWAGFQLFGDGSSWTPTR